MRILDDENVRDLMLLAWNDSQPGTPHAHEEGGFIVRQTDGTLGLYVGLAVRRIRLQCRPTVAE